MSDTFLMASTSAITVQSLGKIVLGAPPVGAKTWCLYVCFSVMLRGRHPVRSRVTYFEQLLCRGLWVDFDMVYIVFKHCLPFQTPTRARTAIKLEG